VIKKQVISESSSGSKQISVPISGQVYYGPGMSANLTVNNKTNKNNVSEQLNLQLLVAEKVYNS